MPHSGSVVLPRLRHREAGVQPGADPTASSLGAEVVETVNQLKENRMMKRLVGIAAVTAAVAAGCADGGMGNRRVTDDSWVPNHVPFETTDSVGNPVQCIWVPDGAVGGLSCDWGTDTP